MEVSEYIPLGSSSQDTFKVEEQYTAAYVGSGSSDVLATPSMIAFIERVAHRLLESHLPDGYSSVGVLVDVRHLAPTPSGGAVQVKCEVKEIDGLRVTFLVQAWDEHEMIGEGRHQRVVIDHKRFLNRVDAKR